MNTHLSDAILPFLETEGHLKVRPGEHIGMLTFTFKKKKSSKESSIRHQLSTAE